MTSRTTGGGAFTPKYAALESAYPAKSVTRAALFEELGIGALIDNKAYTNTCAIRMSYAVTRAGVVLRKGGLKFNKGPYKGMRIEPGMQKLAMHLAELWGDPEKYLASKDTDIALIMRKGVIAFFFKAVPTSAGAMGHIELLKPRPFGLSDSAQTCAFGSNNHVWFWPLD
ncbi:MAG: T6SS effector amidase Tae4 family protein [Telluria sp.]